MANDIKQPSSPRAQENEFEDILEFMVQQITQRFENNVIKELNQSTVEKFTDAAPGGNYAKVLVTLANRTRRKIRKQFDNERIEAMVADTLRKVDKRQQQQLYAAVEKAIGVSTVQLAAREGMTYTINALVMETAQWVKKLRDETLETFTNNTLNAMTTGDSLSTIMEQFKDVAEKRKNHAKYLAHNQIQNFNSITSKIRVQKLGIKKAVWETAGDESVRPSHADRDGKEFNIGEGLYSSLDGEHLIPGVDHNCRCTARYILEDEEED